MTLDKDSKEEIIDKVNSIIEEYDTKLTLRQIYYRLVASLTIENTINQYKRLSRILVDARISGDVPFDAFEDRSRGIVSNDIEGHEDVDIDDVYESRKETYEAAEDDFRNSSIWHSRWNNQEYRIVVMLEKDALARIVGDVCSTHSVDFLPCKGYPSLTILKDFVTSMEEADNDDDKEIKILYFGDFDPSGMDIPRYIGDTLEKLDMYDFTIERIGLTIAQIDNWNLPHMPTKKADSRSSGFIAKHGDIAVELDAIDPNDLKKMVYESIRNNFDQDTYEKSRKDAKNRTHELQDKIAEHLDNEEE